MDGMGKKKEKQWQLYLVFRTMRSVLLTLRIICCPTFHNIFRVYPNRLHYLVNVGS